MDADAPPHTDADPFMPALAIPQAIERFNTVVEFVKSVMREGIDFGTIPGTPKPTLYKPGAEKLCTLFGLSCRLKLVHQVEDWSGAAFEGEPFFYYLYRYQLWRGDLLVAEADGSCNSRESRYRWRWVGEEQLPAGVDRAALQTRGGLLSEFAFAIERAETSGSYGKPASYWQAWQEAIDTGRARPTVKKSRAGRALEGWERDGTLYRLPNDDIASQVNTIQKMAQKRALVAATLIAVNASEFFTQDLEDLELIELKASPVEPARDEAEQFYAEACQLGYFDRQDVIGSLRRLGYTGIPKGEGARRAALDRLRALLEGEAA